MVLLSICTYEFWAMDLKCSSSLYVYILEFSNYVLGVIVMVMVFNAPCNSNSEISWRSVSLVEETGVPGEKQQPVGSHFTA